MDRLDTSRTLSRQGNRIAARQREKRRHIDRLIREAERSSPEAAQRREFVRAATRSGRAAVKARAAADRRLADALNRLVDGGLSIREASERIGISYHQARQLLRPGPARIPSLETETQCLIQQRDPILEPVDVIEFRIAVEDGEGKVTPGLTIHPLVNGVALKDLAKPVEQPFANADGSPDQAGDYMGLVQVDHLRWPARLYLGDPLDTWFDDGDTTLLGCICGESGCWPLTAFVEVGRDVVTWRNFRNGHRDWDLSALGPFVFDRTHYETALHATAKGA